jgi:uncharacterized ubiquitin-like protein YukD
MIYVIVCIETLLDIIFNAEEIKASKNSKKNIEAENKDISISNINSKIDNSDFVII